MVNRKTPEFTTEFNGKVVNITIEKDKNEMSQYHLEILPLDLEIKGKTGYMHEWIRITKETTDTDIIEGSILDFYIQDLELCDKSVKNMKTHQEVLFFMKDKCFQFAKKK
jgi:protein-tyrosine phosphatase